MEQFKNVAAMNVQVGRGFLIEKVFFWKKYTIQIPEIQRNIHEGRFKYFPHNKPFRFVLLNNVFLEIRSQAFYFKDLRVANEDRL